MGVVYLWEVMWAWNLVVICLRVVRPTALDLLWESRLTDFALWILWDWGRCGALRHEFVLGGQSISNLYHISSWYKLKTWIKWASWFYKLVIHIIRNVQLREKQSYEYITYYICTHVYLLWKGYNQLSFSSQFHSVVLPHSTLCRRDSRLESTWYCMLQDYSVLLLCASRWH